MTHKAKEEHVVFSGYEERPLVKKKRRVKKKA